ACESVPTEISGESASESPVDEDLTAAPGPEGASANRSASSALRKQTPAFAPLDEGSCRFCHHAGVLLFSRALLEFGENFPPETAPLLKQWLASVLLGAINIEQSKFLDFDDLEVLLGSSARSLHPQRVRLTEMGRGDTAENLQRLNAEQCTAAQGTDFYYDPHTKQYTGAASILKGWCGSIRRADKALHTDFIHDSCGTPLYMQWADNYNDLRERFRPNIERFRTLAKIEPDRVLTITVDRGIYGMEVFEGVLAEKNLHIITWEKGYRAGAWPVGAPTETFVLQRPRNRASDLRSYRFEYIDRPWEKNPAIRQILVRATNPAGRTAEVSILTDDPKRSARETIRTIFWRWLQENDFKYLDKHFGINQITSYAVLDYEELREKVEDKQMKNGERQALATEKNALKRELGRLLVTQRAYRRKQEKGNQKGKATTSNKAEIRRQSRIEAIDLRCVEIDALLESTAKEVSRLEKLVAENKQRLDTSNKSVMDGVKIIARNAFYRALAPFKSAYDNYRDDHDYFRKLTQSHGLLVGRSDRLEVHLITPVNFPPKIQRIIENLLAKINQQNLLLPDGSQRVLQFFLGQKAGFKLAPQTPHEPLV
ncbi:MAG: putative transposase, partial [Opitutales bacterium]